MADVTFQRSDYDLSLPDWQLIADVCAGERAIKLQTTRYLPKPNPFDVSNQNKDRYKSYVARASFFNATGHTQRGMVGAVYRKPPEILLPSLLDYAMTGVDGVGVSITQQSRSVLNSVIGKGRHALWVDYPETTDTVSVADLQSGRVRANIISIDASQVINWRTEKVDATHRLSLVVIAEGMESVTDDGFGVSVEKQFRVLRLLDGVYVVEIWRAPKKSKKYSLVESHAPLDGSGRSWDVIPFTFIGSQNNDALIDQPPMLDLATLNIAHYRNSADYEDSAFFVGQAQPWISGLTEEWRDHLEKKGVYVGSRTPIPLPEGGAFGIAQAAPNTLVKEAMDSKERQMVALGARLLEKGGAVKTATEAQSDSEREHSVLSLAAENVSEAYRQSLGFAARYMNADGDIEFALNTDFISHSLDAQTITALIQAWQSGKLPASDLWSKFRQAGLIDAEKTDEQIREELDSEASGLSLDNVNAQ